MRARLVRIYRWWKGPRILYSLLPFPLANGLYALFLFLLTAAYVLVCFGCDIDAVPE